MPSLSLSLSLSLSARMLTPVEWIAILFFPFFFFYTMQCTLGCTDTPFLAKYRCPTRARLRCLSGVFFFAFPTRLQHGGHANSEKKKPENHRFWQIDKSLPLILWYTLKQKSLESEKSLPWKLKPTPACCPLSLAGARSGQSASQWAP